MGGKVTAVGMDVITETSGHVSTPLAVSVCTTPAAPSPIPVPYPVVGTSREGIAGATMRTRIHGASIGTVGSALTTCHGNEPGTLKETLSLNTGGACVIVAGAPVVLCELGMMGITGSPVLQNRMAGPTVRSAPAPNIAPGPGMCPAVAVLGAGADAGGANGQGPGDGNDNANGGGGGGGDGADGDGKGAPGGAPGQCSGGEPIDVVTGRVYTFPIADLALPGPLPLVFARVYSSAAAEMDFGLGPGWAHAWGWTVEVHRRRLVVWSDEGIAVDFPALDVGAEAIGAWGWLLRHTRDGYELDTGDGLRRTLAAADAGGRRFRLVALTDRNGNRSALTYDGARLVEVLDSAGRTVRVESTPAGCIRSLAVRNAKERGRWIVFASYTYDDAGDLVQVTDAAGYAWRYAYDDAHRLTRHVDRCGLAFCYRYDGAGRGVETWGELPEGESSLVEDVPARLADGTTPARGIFPCRIEYGPDGYREAIDSTQVRRIFGNAHGLVDKLVEGGGVATATYDAHGHRTSRTNELGATTTYERDARGRVLRVVDPLGRTTTIARDMHGLPITITDPAGGVTEIHRDAHGNALHEADPTGSTTSYEYDSRGLVVGVLSPTGARTRYRYDDAGNRIACIEPGGGLWRWSYDALGRCTAEVDPLGRATRYAWTERGDMAAIYNAEGRVTRYAYDGERRCTAETDPLGRTWRTTWGHYHKPIAETDPLGHTTRARYNREGELVEVVNALGESHRFAYSPAGQLLKEQTFDGRRLAYRYDPARRLVRSQDGPAILEFTYDDADQLLAREHDDGTLERFAYDGRGALVCASWPGGEVRFERDAAGRILREIQEVGGEVHGIERALDKDGFVIRRRTSLGHVEQIDRDPNGARVRTLLDERHEITHTRDPLGRELLRRLPRGGRLLREYSPLGRLRTRRTTAPSSLRPTRPGTPAWSGEPDRVTTDTRYHRDEAGDLSDAFDRRRGWLRYTHDDAGRLLAVEREKTGEREAFRYDPAGNLHDASPEPAREARTYGPGGRLLRRGATAYAWDAAGRLVERRTPHPEGGDEVWRYTWDAAERLTGVERPDGGRIAYAYDPLGRRVEARTFAAPRPGARTELRERTRWVWDGDTLVHALRTEARAEGDPVTEERTYCFEDEAPFVPWAEREAGPDGFGGRRSAWCFHLVDPAGTPEALLGGDGGVLGELDRRAWGRTEPSYGARATTALRFQGQIEDAATGLHYNRFRYYDPEIGGYLSPDPLRLGGGLRLYGYVPDPLGWVDPLGLAGRKVPLEEGGFMVYGLYAPGVANPYYVGITNNERRREDEHARRGQLVPGGKLRPLEEDLTYAQARGAEQAYMEHYGTKGPFPGNDRNSFGPRRKDDRARAFQNEYQKKKSTL